MERVCDDDSSNIIYCGINCCIPVCENRTCKSSEEFENGMKFKQTKNVMYKINIAIICITCMGINSVAQKQAIKPDISNNDHFQVINRDVNVFTNGEGENYCSS